MKFPTALLWVNSALFVVFGACFIAAPELFSTVITGAAPGTSSAFTDMRATYGGMGLGVGLLFGFCARQPSTVHVGLIASLFVLGSTAAARIVGFLADGSPNAFMFFLLGAELLFVALLIVALKQFRSGKAFY